MLRMGLPVNVYTVTIAVNCCCLLKDTYSAFAIMGLFFKRGYEPNTVTFSTLIRGLFLDNEVEAVKLFEKVLDLKLCVPDNVMILHVIDGLCKAGQVVASHDWLCRLESSGWRPNVKAYSALIDGFCKCGNMDDAFQVLIEMVGKGISPTIVTYNSVIKGLCDDSRLTDVEYLLNEMANSKIFSDVFTYNILIDALCKEGNLEEGVNVLETMMQHNICPDVVTYSTLINGFRLQGEIERAKQLFDFMVEKGVSPNVVTCNILIDGYCSLGEMVRGIELDSLYHEGKAGRLMVEMEKSGCAPDGVTFNIIVWNLVKSKKVREAILFLEEMCRRGFEVNSEIISAFLLHELRIGEGKDEKLQEIVKKVCAQSREVNAQDCWGRGKDPILFIARVIAQVLMPV